MTAQRPRNMSHSKLGTWPADDNPNGCQSKYAFSYVFYVPQAPGAANIAGTAFHAALELDGKRKLAGHGGLSIGELISQAYTTLDAELAKLDTGRVLTNQRANIAQRLETMIGLYVAHVQRYYTPGDVPERSFEIKDIPGVVFGGFIDATTYANEGKPRNIIDWKQTKALFYKPGTRWAKEWIEDLEHTHQATAYLMADPAAASVQFVVFAVHPDTPDRGEVKRYIIKRDEAREQRYRARVATVAQEMAAAESTGKYDATVGNLCPWCNYIHVCPAGQAWMQSNGKTAQVPRVPHTVTCAECGGVADVTGYQTRPKPHYDTRCIDCGVVGASEIVKRKRESNVTPIR